MFPEEWRFYTTEADSFLIPSSRNRERERENGTRDSLWRSRRHERRANPSSSSGETRFRRRDPFPTVRQVTRSVFLVMWVSTIHLSHPPALPTSPPSSSLFFLSLSTHFSILLLLLLPSDILIFPPRDLVVLMVLVAMGFRNASSIGC